MSSAISAREGGSGNQNQPGVITAGEWNDLDNWNFWNDILGKDGHRQSTDKWGFYNSNRISLNITGTDSLPIGNVLVRLKENGAIIFTTITDNNGNAELWRELFQNNGSASLAGLQLDIDNGAKTVSPVTTWGQGINRVTLPARASAADGIQISFVVDATGSMSDELEYLKTELGDVISRVKSDNPKSPVSISSVFYRDEGDEYVTKVSNFTENVTDAINFIQLQRADGGGDFPEAVDKALEKAMNNLEWAAYAKSRIIFLLLDAPPHSNASVIENVHNSIIDANKKGIKIIPVTASGIDKETEFLMRSISISTSGTYVFITNDSGIGDSHLPPSVGPFQVEFLNNLMVRLINKYSK